VLDVDECPVIQPKTNPTIPVVKRHNLYEGRIYFSSVAEHHHHNSVMLTPSLVASVITSKAANGYHLKTGQRDAPETQLFYLVSGSSGKSKTGW
jgi:hypothetical protein